MSSPRADDDETARATPRLVVVADAEADISDVLLFTELRWGGEQRRAYETLLTEALESIRDHPDIGRLRGSGPRAYRTLPMREHVIYYRFRERDNVVLVLRVMHAKQRKPRSVNE